jgi:hypothetical protein
MSRTRLLSHYEIAQLTESKLKNRAISPITRKRLQLRIAEEIHTISDSERASVLTIYSDNSISKRFRDYESMSYGNAMRKLAKRYGIKEV